MGLGVLNGMLGPTPSICLSGVLRDSPLCGPINAGSCLNHAWLRRALNICEIKLIITYRTPTKHCRQFLKSLSSEIVYCIIIVEFQYFIKLKKVETGELI